MRDTPDQVKVTTDVKRDMEGPPMDRLVCGDVGFGKTEIAIRAAFKAVCDNRQGLPFLFPPLSRRISILKPLVAAQGLAMQYWLREPFP